MLLKIAASYYGSHPYCVALQATLNAELDARKIRLLHDDFDSILLTIAMPYDGTRLYFVNFQATLTANVGDPNDGHYDSILLVIARSESSAVR
jgi:hypothetical protein